MKKYGKEGFDRSLMVAKKSTAIDIDTYDAKDSRKRPKPNFGKHGANDSGTSGNISMGDPKE